MVHITCSMCFFFLILTCYMSYVSRTRIVKILLVIDHIYALLIYMIIVKILLLVKILSYHSSQTKDRISKLLRILAQYLLT